MLVESSQSHGRSDGSQSQYPQTPENSSLRVSRARPLRSFAILAGWMTVAAGVLAFFNGFMALFGQSSSGVFDFVIDPDRYTICATLIMAFGVVSVAGGISAIRGKSMSLALAGAALGVIGDGVIGFWLGLAAILCLFLSSEDF